MVQSSIICSAEAQKVAWNEKEMHPCRKQYLLTVLT
jgi:hypothetical protein